MFLKFKNKKGSMLVLYAVFLTTLLGFGALAIDLGIVVLEKQKIQNAIDASTLAAAQDLPDTNKCIDTANQYIELNGFEHSDITINFSDSNKKISIKSTKEVNYALAKFIGFDSTTINSKCTVEAGIAASVPWIVPFVIPKPPEFNYDEVYVMRIYGKGDFIDYPYPNYSTPAGFPRGYSYPWDWRNDSVYGSYSLCDPYPYQFDYMNVYITKNASFNEYINWLEYGYHETFSINDNMYYMAPSSGGRQSVDVFSNRVLRDSNSDYTKAKIGDARVILIPVVESMLSLIQMEMVVCHLQLLDLLDFL